MLIVVMIGPTGELRDQVVAKDFATLEACNNEKVFRHNVTASQIWAENQWLPPWEAKLVPGSYCCVMDATVTECQSVGRLASQH